jgi:hypothetical protein
LISRDLVFRFGPFELSEREGELRKNGVRLKLQEQLAGRVRANVLRWNPGDGRDLWRNRGMARQQMVTRVMGTFGYSTLVAGNILPFPN